jgi:hypothetical protein
MHKFIILNGPPRCGKDTAAKAVEKYFSPELCLHIKMSAPLKSIVKLLTQQPEDYIETFKENPLEELNNHSYRSAQIEVFEKLAEVFGEDWLGKVAVRRIQQSFQEFFIFSDGGREMDILPLLKEYGEESIMIIQIQRDGCNFKGDIRHYLSLGASVRLHSVVNEEIKHFELEIIDLVADFLADN